MPASESIDTGACSNMAVDYCAEKVRLMEGERGKMRKLVKSSFEDEGLLDGNATRFEGGSTGAFVFTSLAHGTGR